MRTLTCGRFQLPLRLPLIMGIVNLTPDSFSGDGLAGDSQRAVAHAQAQIDAGANIVDIGAESTRPGAESVSESEELDRLLPVLRALRDAPVPVSVDTMTPGVMRAALAEGASMINDVAALSAPGAIEAVVATQAAVCLMHMRGDPRSMQQQPSYGDVVAEVSEYLDTRARACQLAGIARDRIVLDPGFGFGKTLDHNLTLLRQLPELTARGYPVLVGVSRKSMLGSITGREVGERLPASIAAALVAVERGAAIVRVHDVAATRDALAVINAVENR